MGKKIKVKHFQMIRCRTDFLRNDFNCLSLPLWASQLETIYLQAKYCFLELGVLMKTVLVFLHILDILERFAMPCLGSFNS